MLLYNITIEYFLKNLFTRSTQEHEWILKLHRKFSCISLFSKSAIIRYMQYPEYVGTSFGRMQLTDLLTWKLGIFTHGIPFFCGCNNTAIQEKRHMCVLTVGNVEGTRLTTYSREKKFSKWIVFIQSIVLCEVLFS